MEKNLVGLSVCCFSPHLLKNNFQNWEELQAKTKRLVFPKVFSVTPRFGPGHLHDPKIEQPFYFLGVYRLPRMVVSVIDLPPTWENFYLSSL